MFASHEFSSVHRFIHRDMFPRNEQYEGLSVIMTADTGVELDNLPIIFNTKDGEENFGTWRVASFLDRDNRDEHLMFMKGDIHTSEPLLVRVHSSCKMNEIFGFRFSDDRLQLEEAMRRIHHKGRGIILYVDQEGAGNRLSTIIAQLKLTNEGQDMFTAFDNLGVKRDNRSFAYAVDMLRFLDVTSPIALLTNNESKIQYFKDAGFEVELQDFKIRPEDTIARRYVETKEHLGLLFPPYSETEDLNHNSSITSDPNSS